jgi:hypothetical protein
MCGYRLRLYGMGGIELEQQEEELQQCEEALKKREEVLAPDPSHVKKLLKIQVAQRTIFMDLTHTWSSILHNRSKMCNESMSMRIWSSITYWCNNDK